MINAKRQRAKLEGGLWAMRVDFRLHYRYRYRLSKCSCFASVTILIVIAIVHRYFLRLSYRNFSSFNIQPYMLAIQPLVGSGCWTVTWRSRVCVLLGLPQVVITVFGQVGGTDGHQGVFHKNIVEMRGHIPPTRSQKGGSRRLFLLRGADSPNSVPEKKEGMRPRHGLRAPCQRFRNESGAGWGTWKLFPRACFPYTPVRLKKGWLK